MNRFLIGVALAASLASPVAAQNPALIPAPREINNVQAAVTVRSPMVVSADNAADRDAGAVFAATMGERHVSVRVSDSAAGYRVELLRTGTPAATKALSSAGLEFTDAMRDEGYVLVSGKEGTRIIGATPAGVFYGLQTLAQLTGTALTGPTIRPVTIRDWPAMRWRGVHDDLSRGPVPTLEYQKRQIRIAAQYKINAWSPYFEQSLEYESHPLIAPPGGAMSHEDVKTLVAYAQRYHITMIPEQEAFGHLHHVLKNEIYAGIGETPHGHVLAPGDPGSLPLIKDMFTEINALFPGPFIHLGADETFELGRGRTKGAVDSTGLPAVYLGFLGDIVKTLRPITKEKRFMFWGDVAEGSPALVKTLPKDMVAVAWGYGSNEGSDRK